MSLFYIDFQISHIKRRSVIDSKYEPLAGAISQERSFTTKPAKPREANQLESSNLNLNEPSSEKQIKHSNHETSTSLTRK